jgi:hypothetical protein
MIHGQQNIKYIICLEEEAMSTDCVLNVGGL